MTFRQRLVALLSALVLLASACGGVTETVDDVAAPASASAGANDADAASGPDLGLLGQGSLEGQDVVVWFWAEW